MKTTISLFLILLLIAPLTAITGNTTNLNNSAKSEFDEFIKLFPDINLPLDVEKLQITKNAIPKNLCEKFIFPNDQEAKEASEIKCVGKFSISNQYQAVIFAYSTGTSGDIKELYIFDKNGIYISSLIVSIDYSSYFMNSTIDAAYNIKTQAYDRESAENGNIEKINYTIVNGKITEKK